LFTSFTISTILVATAITISACGHYYGPRIGANDVKGGLFKQAVEESSVLLKNKNNLLPLTRNTRIDLFGVTQINTFYGGGGSGDVYYPYHAVNILDGIRHNPGLRVNEDLAHYYEEAIKTGNYDNGDDT
jgi:beta-glucosidase-like glycosyl hydrolase